MGYIALAAACAIAVWFIIDRRCAFIGGTENSIVTYFNDVVMYDPEYGETVNKCTDCNVLYSNYVRHNRKPCPRCGSKSKKARVDVKMYKSKRNNFFSIIKKYWIEV